MGAVVRETRYLWCGETLCRADSYSGAVGHISRRYFKRGEVNLDLAGGRSLLYQQDQLGSVRDVLDASSGAVLASTDYGPYGTVTSRTLASGITEMPTDFAYAGLVHHEASGLELATYRAYSAESGKWLNPDPAGFASGDTNLYEYVGNSPINWVDPAGLARCVYSIGAKTLVCTSNSGDQSITLNANMGVLPLPKGSYEIRKVPGQQQGTWFLDPGLLSRIGYRLSLNRGGFNIHLPGNRSAGCISVPQTKNPGSGIQDLDTLFSNESGNNILDVVQ